MAGSRLRTLFQQLLHLDEPPHRTALAFATGVFITFSPPYGLHMVMALVCVWAFRMNMVALGAGVFLNTPWTLVPTLGLCLWIGCLVLGVPFPTSLDWSDTSASGIFVQVMPYIVPFLVGSTLLSVVASLLAYPIALTVITKLRARRRPQAPAPLPPETPIR
ncbi:MAG: DUF2062 domain-containing protein [Nitrospiraceae bacterium]